MRGDNHCIFTHADTEKEVVAHVNRLNRFHPWSSTIISTSPEWDEKRQYAKGGVVEKGQFIVVGLEDLDCPFGIGKVTQTSEEGFLEFQWYSNRANNVRGTFLPGWMNKKGDCYYSERPRHASHEPFTATDTDTRVLNKDVIISNFELTEGQRLQVSTLRAIGESGEVNWQCPF